MTAAWAVQALSEIAGEAEQDYADDVDARSNPEACAIVLAAIRDARQDLAKFAATVEADLMAAAGERRFTVDGLGEVEIKKTTKRTQWANEDLTKVVVARALDERIVDEATGEYEPREQAVARVLSECARPSWRLTPLRARAIDPDEFSTVTEESYGVQLPPRVVEP